MKTSVFDASTVLALMLEEPVIELGGVLGDVSISAVNLCEVRSKLIDLGRFDPRFDLFLDLVKILPFTAAQALIASELRSATRPLGLSVGDRACLALGIELGADVYTADRAWLRLELPCATICVRP